MVFSLSDLFTIANLRRFFSTPNLLLTFGGCDIFFKFIK
jgi:hypothetical protein